MLAKRNLNNVETLMSEALLDFEITHEKFKTIVDEKQRYEQMKEDIKNIKSSDEKVKTVEIMGKFLKIHKFKKQIF